MAENVVLRIVGYEEPDYKPSPNAVSRWRDTLKLRRTDICEKLAMVFNIEVAEGQDPCQALANVSPEKFMEVIGSVAPARWAERFGITEQDPRYNMVLKMTAKLARASTYWGKRISEAFTTYFVDRVDSSADKWAERVITIRFVGDPPYTRLGIAPLIAYYLTGMSVPDRLLPPHAEVQGQAGYYINPVVAEYVRPTIIAKIVRHGVYARYALDAGLDNLAQAFLQSLANDLNTLFQHIAAEGYTITFEAGIDSPDWAGMKVVRFAVTVTQAATGG